MNENAQKWVQALRSGKYTQGKSRLAYHNTEGHLYYCCLGVACDLAVKEGLPIRVKSVNLCNGAKAFVYDDNRSTLPDTVLHWLGLRTVTGVFGPPKGEHLFVPPSLTNLNDDGISFTEIADFIESKPEGLFE